MVSPKLTLPDDDIASMPSGSSLISLLVDSTCALFAARRSSLSFVRELLEFSVSSAGVDRSSMG